MSRNGRGSAGKGRHQHGPPVGLRGAQQRGVVDREDVREELPLRGEIEFRHLTFRYPGAGIDALTDASFTIHAGENVFQTGRLKDGYTVFRFCAEKPFTLYDLSISFG